MDFVTSVKVVLRHWKLVAAGLLVTVALLGATFALVSPSYRASAVVTLIQPQGKPYEPARGTAPPLDNPLLTSGGNLFTTANLMVTRMTDAEVVKRTAEAGATAPYEIQQNLDTGTPFLYIVVTGDDANSVIQTLNAVRKSIAAELERYQLAEPYKVDDPLERIGLGVVRTDVVPAAGYGSRIRALVGVMVLGVGGSLAAAFVADAIGEARRRRAGLAIDDDAGVAEGAAPETRRAAANGNGDRVVRTGAARGSGGRRRAREPAVPRGAARPRDSSAAEPARGDDDVFSDTPWRRARAAWRDAQGAG